MLPLAAVAGRKAPRRWQGPFQGAANPVQIESEKTSVLLMRRKDVKVAPNGFSGKNSPFVGAVDGFDPLVGISGWVVSGHAPDDTVRVEAICAEESIGSVLATAPRPDIAHVLGREALCGFTFRWRDFDANVVGRLSESGDKSVGFLVGDRRYALRCVNGDIKVSQIAAAAQRAKADVGDLVAELMGSALFDDHYYRSKTGIGGTRADAIEHYLDLGESQDISPSARFDVAFYRQVYGKFAREPFLLLDFIRRGKEQRRYGTWEALEADVRKVQNSGLFDPEHYYDQQRGHFDAGLADIEQHLAYAWWRGAHASREFDDRFYFHFYDDVKSSGLVPLVHYAEIGRRHWRLTTDAAYREVYEVVSPSFDEDYYRIINPDLPADCDAVRHYLSVGLRSGLQPRRDFSPEFYWRRNPELRHEEPLSHFLRHGHNEGRGARPDFAAMYRTGAKAYDRTKKTVLLVSHDGSRTGAPLVSYALGEAMSDECNIVHMVLRDGPLVRSLQASSIGVVVGNPDAVDCHFLVRELATRWGVEAAVLSSVETVVCAEAAVECGIATVALIHEFPEYTVPAGKVARMIAAADVVVTPAKMVEEAAQKEVLRCFGAHASNMRVRPQGYLGCVPQDETAGLLSAAEILDRIGAPDGDRPRIVLGAGYVQIRKGIDLFVQTAACVRDRCKHDVRFIWVGSGYEPNADMVYSTWVRETVARLGLEKVVHFLPEQSDLETVYRLCDIFFLPSRLDPFPNVVVDAAMHDKPVVAFRHATGAAEWIDSGEISGRLVGYLDTNAAADAITAILDSTGHDSPGSSGAKKKRSGKERFAFAAYAAFLGDLLAEATQARGEQMKAVERIEASGAFDADFHEGRMVAADEARLALLHYASRATKGLSYYSPRPGFHDGLYRNGHDLANRAPLDHALQAGSSRSAPATHTVVTLNACHRGPSPKARVALHLHLHFPELGDEFAELVAAMDREVDLFLTTTSSDKELAVRHAFAGHKTGTVQTFVVPNRGRDIGPFATLLHQPITSGGYDLVGHFHSKKSVELGPDAGDRWRSYLLSLLCGGKAGCDQIIDMFLADDRLGLVFAEDRHVVGWAENRAVAEALAARLTPPPKLPVIPCFPLGTMFWARPAALQPLWNLKLDWSDYPVEPLAKDGTVLHALERLLPSICEAAGFGWQTVYRRGTGW